MSHETFVMHGTTSISSLLSPQDWSNSLVFTSNEFSFGEGKLMEGRTCAAISAENNHPFIANLLEKGLMISVVADTFVVVGINSEDEEDTFRLISDVLEDHFSGDVDFLDVGDAGILLQGKIACEPSITEMWKRKAS